MANVTAPNSTLIKTDASGAPVAAVAKTDYAPATSGSAILKGDGVGGFNAASAGTDYAAPNADTTGKAAKADALTTASGIVSVSAASAPSTGQVLMATGATTATWQTPTGAVSSVNSKTGTVVLTTADIAASTDKQYVTDAELTTLSNLTSGSTLNLVKSVSGGGAGLGNPGTESNIVTEKAVRDAITAGTAGVSSVSGTAPIVSSGGATPAISISAATTSAAGSMSSSDKTKLDAITGTNTGDQLTFKTITVGATDIVADSTTDVLTFIAGANITLTPNDTNDSITIAASASSGMTNPMTAAGDVIYGGTAGAPTALAKGADGTVLTISASTHLPVWQAAAGTGTVTSVTAGNGMTQSGTSTINPTLDVVSAAGTAGSVGTLVVTSDAVGVSLGTTSTTAAAGNDSRLSDARTPTTHASTHYPAGADPVNAHPFHGVVSRSSVPGPLPSTITSASNINFAFSSSNITYYRNSVKTIVTTDKTVSLVSGAGLYWIYFSDDAGTLSASTTFPGVTASSGYVLIAGIYWNGTNLGLVHDERHGYDRDTAWHTWAHQTVGTRYGSGLDLTGSTPSGTGASASLQMLAGSIYDEDINMAISASASWNGGANKYRYFYQTGASTYAFVNTLDTPPFYRGANNRPNVVNTTGYALTELPSAATRYVNAFVYATNDVYSPIYIFTETLAAADVTAGGYTSTAIARAVAWPNLSGFGLAPEMKPIYRMVIRADGAMQAFVASSDDYRSVTSLPQAAGNTSTNAASVSYTPTTPEAQTTVQGALDNRPNYNTLGALSSGFVKVTTSTGALTSDATPLTSASGASATNQLVISAGADRTTKTTGITVADSTNAVAGAGTAINTQTASYTLVLADAGKTIEMNVGSGNTLTIPAAGSVSFPIGTVINIVQVGAGQTTVAITSDTLVSSGSKVKLTGQYSGATLYKRASTTWVLIGDLSA